jgi:EmrB/QacA subfamily drug resistance transporter
MSPTSHHERRWLILALIGIAQLMIVLDLTIVNIALPSAQEDLGFSDDARQWVITAYALAFGSLLLLGGKLGDLFGRKWAFIGGLLGFAAASAVGGAAGSFGVLVGARAAQGVFGALLAPSALALLATTFTDPAERGKAFGIFGAIAGGGSAIGLLLGGILTEWLDWRWCLYVNLLIAVPAAFAALRLIENVSQPSRPKLDIVGAALATSGLFALVYGFSNSEMNSWGHPVTIIALAAAVVLLSTFAWVESRVEHPLLPLRVVADRVRGGSYLAIGISGTALFAVFLFLTYYLQQTKGFSPIETGLAYLPMTAAIMITATSVNIKILARTGPRPLLVLGMALGALAMVIFAQLETDSSYVGHVMPGLIVMGIGMGNIFAPAISSATYGVAPTDQGVASAMVNTMQQVGGSIGTALLSSIFASAVASYAEGRAPSPQVAADAAMHGYTVAFWVAAGVFTFGGIVVGTLMRSVKVQVAHAPGEATTAEPVAVHS